MKIPDPKRLPSGNYNIQLRIGNGKRISITKPTAAACRKEALTIKSKVLNDARLDDLSARDIKISDACLRFLEDKEAVLSPETICGYYVCYRNYFPDIMHRKMGDRINWQKEISKESRVHSPKTVRNGWGFLKSVYTYHGIELPQVTLPQKIQKDLPWLSYDQICILAKAIEGKPVELGCLLALNGLRRSEIYALDKTSIDTEKMIIRVRGASVYKRGEGYIIKPTNKSDTSRRDVPILFPRIVDLVSASDGKLMYYSENKLREKINAECSVLGLPEVGVHGCRRSFASWCAHEKVPEDICKKWGGWSDYRTMHEIYMKYSEADKDSYAERMRGKMSDEMADGKLEMADGVADE